MDYFKDLMREARTSNACVSGRERHWVVNPTVRRKGHRRDSSTLVGNTGKCLVLGHHVARWEEFGEV